MSMSTSRRGHDARIRIRALRIELEAAGQDPRPNVRTRERINEVSNDGMTKSGNEKQGHCDVKNGYPVSEIQERLSQEGVSVLRVSLFALIKKFKKTKLVVDL